MKAIFICLLFAFFIEAKAQVSYSFIGWGSEKNVMKEYKKNSLSKEFIAKGYSTAYTKIGDTLLITMNDPKKNIRKLVFTRDGGVCKFDQSCYSFCDSSYQELLDITLEDKQMGWKQISKNKYMSKWFWRRELTITNNAENFCGVMTFKLSDLPKEEYTTLYENAAWGQGQANADSVKNLFGAPPNFSFFVKLDKPFNLKWGIPGEILFDSLNKFFIISYDFNPSHLDFYNIYDWKLVKRVEIPGFVYFYNSFFRFSEHAVYIEIGRFSSKFVRIDLTNFSQSVVPCADSPRGCVYIEPTPVKSESLLNSDIRMITEDRYIIKYNDTKAEIYLKK